MSSKSYCFIVVNLLTVLVLSAQTITVLEKESNEPIAGVLVTNSNKSKTAITDLKGKVALDVFDQNEEIYFQNFFYQSVKFNKSQLVLNNRIVYLTLSIEGLNQVVVSASKFEQFKRDVPQTIVSLNQSDIEFANPQTSADLLEGTGNIYIQKSQLGGGSPIIRGFSTNRLLIAVDGVRMNNAIFRGGNLQNIISIDPFSVQSTEITLGAGSVVYGSDAIGGVMNFYTKKPQLSYKDELFFKANASLRYSSANEESTSHLDLNFGFKKWAFLGSFSFTDFDDLRMGSQGPKDYLRPEYVVRTNNEDIIVANSNPLIQVPTAYDQINFMQKVRFEASDDLLFDFGVHFSTTSDFSRYDRLVRYRNNQLSSAEWNYGPQQWLMTNAQLTRLRSRSNFYNKLQATVAFQNFRESRSDRDFQSEVRQRRSEEVNAFNFNLDLEKDLTNKTILFYGLEFVHNRIMSDGTTQNIVSNTSMPTVTRYPDGSSWQSNAAYLSLNTNQILSLCFNRVCVII